jgi:hypothetical protein
MLIRRCGAFEGHGCWQWRQGSTHRVAFPFPPSPRRQVLTQSAHGPCCHHEKKGLSTTASGAKAGIGRVFFRRFWMLWRLGFPSLGCPTVGASAWSLLPLLRVPVVCQQIFTCYAPKGPPPSGKARRSVCLSLCRCWCVCPDVSNLLPWPPLGSPFGCMPSCL